MAARGSALAALALAACGGARLARASCLVDGNAVCGQGNGAFDGTLPNGEVSSTCFCDSNCFDDEGQLNDCCPDVCDVCPELPECKALAEAGAEAEETPEEGEPEPEPKPEAESEEPEPEEPSVAKPDIAPEVGKNRTVVQDPRFAAGVVTTVAGSGEPAIGVTKEDDGIGNGTAFLALRGMAGSAPEDCESDKVYMVDQKLSKVRQVNTVTK